MEKVNWRCEFMEDIVDEIENSKFYFIYFIVDSQ